MEKVEIPLSKRKLLLGIMGSIMFVAIGVFFCISKEINVLFIKFVGVVAIFFFGATCIYGMRKIFDNKIGLVIDENGIFDNSNAGSVGIIKWEDITGIKTVQVESTKIFLIYTLGRVFKMQEHLSICSVG